MYFAQNGSYATLDELVSSGVLNLSLAGRDGYSHGVETSPFGFVATARHSNVFPVSAGVEPPRYPTLSVDQSMRIRQIE
jgi:hypothetical protein